jgi:hypothetical protein
LLLVNPASCEDAWRADHGGAPPVGIRRSAVRFRVLTTRAILGVTPLLALAAPARAGLPVRFSLAAGWTFPVAPSSISDLWNGSAAFAAGATWRATSRVAIWADVGYYRHAFDTDAYESTISDLFPNVNASGNDLQVVPVSIGADVALTGWGNTRPYVSAGIGYYNVSVTKPEASGPQGEAVEFPDPSDEAFGARFGLGVRTLVTPAVTLFVDATYHRAWTSPDALGFVPLRLGLRF